MDNPNPVRQTDPPSANHNHSSPQPSTASAAQGVPATNTQGPPALVAEPPTPEALAAPPQNGAGEASSLAAHPHAVASAAERRKIRRNGRIACLPKLQRDMVNRMLWNGVPYKNIVGALEEADFTVTE